MCVLASSNLVDIIVKHRLWLRSDVLAELRLHSARLMFEVLTWSDFGIGWERRMILNTLFSWQVNYITHDFERLGRWIVPWRINSSLQTRIHSELMFLGVLNLVMMLHNLWRISLQFEVYVSPKANCQALRAAAGDYIATPVDSILIGNADTRDGLILDLGVPDAMPGMRGGSIVTIQRNRALVDIQFIKDCIQFIRSPPFPSRYQDTCD